MHIFKINPGNTTDMHSKTYWKRKKKYLTAKMTSSKTSTKAKLCQTRCRKSNVFILTVTWGLFVCVFCFLDTSYQMGLQIARFTMRQEETLYSPCFLLTTSKSLAPEKCSEVQPRKTLWVVFFCKWCSGRSVLITKWLFCPKFASSDYACCCACMITCSNSQQDPLQLFSDFTYTAVTKTTARFHFIMHGNQSKQSSLSRTH